MRRMGAPVSPAAASVDAVLTGVAEAFDYLLYVQPTNSNAAWHEFSATAFRSEPRFTYRDIDVDVEGLQRQLDDMVVDDVEDEVIGRLLERKRRELLHYLGLLRERGTPGFLRRSIAVSGRVEDELAALAERVLRWSLDAEPGPGATVAPEAFVERAEDELRAYRRQDPSLTGTVQVRTDIVALMVSGDQVLVPDHRRLPAPRVEPLIHHEIGVHVLTCWNGRVQPLRMFAEGLGGFLEAQEGLGVLAELLCGGLTPARLGVLAGRVLAAHSVIDGATFMETFTDLHHGRGLPAASAFGLANRVHGGGGLVKDAVYLRGLVRVVAYLQDGGDLDLLLVGKPSLDDLDDVAELLERGVLVGPRVRPHWLDGEGGERLARLRAAPDVATVLLA
jgi:uncharacterized protein (TIGR02421 family)